MICFQGSTDFCSSLRPAEAAINSELRPQWSRFSIGEETTKGKADLKGQTLRVGPRVIGVREKAIAWIPMSATKKEG
jgi:hypothetical protein